MRGDEAGEDGVEESGLRGADGTVHEGRGAQLGRVRRKRQRCHYRALRGQVAVVGRERRCCETGHGGGKVRGGKSLVGGAAGTAETNRRRTAGPSGRRVLTHELDHPRRVLGALSLAVQLVSHPFLQHPRSHIVADASPRARSLSMCQRRRPMRRRLYRYPRRRADPSAASCINAAAPAPDASGGQCAPRQC